MALKSIFFFLILSLSLFACRKTIDANGMKVDLEIQTLSNGLTVILLEDHHLPLVSYQTWVRVGSVDEETGKTGLAHLFERLYFKGSQKFDSKAIFELVEGQGGLIRSRSSRDYLTVQNLISPEQLDPLISIEAERLMGLKFSSEILQSEVLLSLEERRLQGDGQLFKMNEALWGLAYRYHPYRWPVSGYPQDLVSLTLEDVEQFYKKYFVPSNTVIVVTGDIQSQSVFEKIKLSYGLLPQKPKPKRDPILDRQQEEERRLSLYDSVVSERLSYAYHIPQAGASDTHALDVLSDILFEGQSSRMSLEVSRQLSPFVEISGTAFTPTYPGLFIFQGVMKADSNTDLGEARVNDILKEIQEKGVSAAEVERAKKHLSIDMLKGLDAPLELGQLMGTVAMVFNSPSEFESDLKKYEQVTAEDVKRVVLKYFFPNNRVVVLLKKKVSPK